MCNNLIDGVNTFGRHKWKDILRNYTFPTGMTPTALRGKWDYLYYRHLVRWRSNKWVLHQITATGRKCYKKQLTDDSTDDEGEFVNASP